MHERPVYRARGHVGGTVPHNFLKLIYNRTTMSPNFQVKTPIEYIEQLRVIGFNKLILNIGTSLKISVRNVRLYCTFRGVQPVGCGPNLGQ